MVLFVRIVEKISKITQSNYPYILEIIIQKVTEKNLMINLT